MKFLVALALLGVVCLQANAAPQTVDVIIDSEGLTADQWAIVNGFTSIVDAFANGEKELDEIQNMIVDVKDRIESKLDEQGPAYLDVLADTLTEKVKMSQESIDLLHDKIVQMVAVEDEKAEGRSRRSPDPKKKKKKGKKCGK